MTITVPRDAKLAHQRDVVGVALTRLRDDLHGERRANVLEQLTRTLRQR